MAVTTVNERLAAARKIGDEFHRALALTDLIPHLPTADRWEVAAEALQAAKSIERRYYRAEALTRLVPYLPIPMLNHALKTARAIEADPDRAEALANIALSLSGDQREATFDEALKTARAIEGCPDRAEALANIASFLSEDRRETVFDEALETAERSTMNLNAPRLFPASRRSSRKIGVRQFLKRRLRWPERSRTDLPGLRPSPI